MLIAFNAERDTGGNVLFPGAVLRLEYCQRRTEYDRLRMLRRQACVIFGAVDDELEPAGQTSGNDFEWLLLPFNKSPQRKEAFRTSMAEDRINKGRKLIPIGFDIDHG